MDSAIVARSPDKGGEAVWRDKRKRERQVRSHRGGKKVGGTFRGRVLEVGSVTM